jgi:hypothetical protein
METLSKICWVIFKILSVVFIIISAFVQVIWYLFWLIVDVMCWFFDEARSMIPYE